MMNSIDTSTTAGKIAVMQAFEDGRRVEISGTSLVNWGLDLSPDWDWDKCTYRTKPQTVEEAAIDYSTYTYNKTLTCNSDRRVAFIQGAQWQKGQMINDIILEQDTDNE